MPAEGADQHTAQHRRQNRRKPHDQHQLRKDLGGLDRIALVADDRPRQNHPGTASQRLDKARTDQPFEARRKGAGHRCEHEQRHADQQRDPSAKAVSHWTVSQLTERQAQKIGGQGQLHVFFIGPEIRGHGREAGKIEVDGQRAESAQ